MLLSCLRIQLAVQLALLCCCHYCIAPLFCFRLFAAQMSNSHACAANVVRRPGQQLADLRLEAEVEHPVRLVEDHHLSERAFGLAFPHLWLPAFHCKRPLAFDLHLLPLAFDCKRPVAVSFPRFLDYWTIGSGLGFRLWA